MSSCIEHWPAFRGFDVASLGGVVRVETARWGKEHGSESDFHWLARSPGFTDLDGRLIELLNLGAQDVPRSAVYWLPVGLDCYAVQAVSSRAVDAGNRSTSIEQRIFHWRRPREIPAVLGAYFLLPTIAASAESIWQPAISSEPQSYEWPSSKLLAGSIQAGVAALAARWSPVEMGRIYSRWYTLGCGLLEGLDAPLPPEALAGVLLPLDREQADRAALAGWVPSSRWDPGQLSWDFIACQRAPASAQKALAPVRRALEHAAALHAQRIEAETAIGTDMQQPERAAPGPRTRQATGGRRPHPSRPDRATACARDSRLLSGPNGAVRRRPA